EPGLISAQAAWNAVPELRWRLLSDIGMPDTLIQKLQQGWRQAFVFCYGDADANALSQALSQSGPPTIAVVPQGVLPQLATLQSDTLQVYESPFVDQDDFDRLLWSSALNIVRGEDSLVRAIWAKRPFLWQPYLQDDNAHLDKLRAWLDIADLPEHIAAVTQAWNQGAADETQQLLTQALRLDQRIWPAW